MVLPDPNEVLAPCRATNTPAVRAAPRELDLVLDGTTPHAYPDPDLEENYHNDESAFGMGG